VSLIPYSGFLLPIMNIDTKLITIIESLQDGINSSEEAKSDPDKGYPYATGYSRATMQHCVMELETIVNQYRHITLEESK